MAPYVPWILAALIGVNLWTLLAFWQDKQRARAGAWRISEENLLCLAAAGGWPAAFLARHMFRHKTRKAPFSTHLQLIAMLEVGAALGLAFACG
ncbi:MAG TPA: DUF1294 domain-containing protein [Allosphingosinicella sp.]|nr:DUF1294 domain-containing protein [Allosphingosinicella sp.]